MYKWGSNEEWLRTTVAKEIGHLPQALQDKPVLDDSLVFYWSAFNALLPYRSRWSGNISLSDIITYCDVYHIDSSSVRQNMILFINALCATYNELTTHGQT